MLCKSFFAASKNRAMQIRAMKNRASRGMTVYDFFERVMIKFRIKIVKKLCHFEVKKYSTPLFKQV